MALYVDIEKNLGKFHLSARFETRDGVLGILGASGCGKSMTLQCIAGIVRPDRGTIVLDGQTLFDSKRQINLPPQRRQVGLLFQNYALFPNMTVQQNLAAGLRNGEKDKTKIEEQTARMMKKFCLEGLENHKPHQLSGGQQQRTALARILLSRPKLLMLDEPFSALDGYLRWNMELELSELLEEFGGRTLFVSHSRDEIYRICHYVCVMDRGSSGEVIPVKGLFERPKTLAAALLSGCKNYSRARPDGEGRVYAKDWGTVFCLGTEEDRDGKNSAEQNRGGQPENRTGQATDRSQKENRITHVGIRSHFLHVVSEGEKDQHENVMECRIQKIIEDVFSMVVMVIPPAAEGGPERGDEEASNSRLRLEMTKEEWEGYTLNHKAQVGDRIWVWVDQKDIMLLE